MARMSTGGRLQKIPKVVPPRVLTREEQEKKNKEERKTKLDQLDVEVRRFEDIYKERNVAYHHANSWKKDANENLRNAKKDLSRFEGNKRKTGTVQEREARLNELRSNLKEANDDFERRMSEYNKAKETKNEAKKAFTNSHNRLKTFIRAEAKLARRESGILKRKETLKKKNLTRAAAKNNKK